MLLAQEITLPDCTVACIVSFVHFSPGMRGNYLEFATPLRLEVEQKGRKYRPLKPPKSGADECWSRGSRCGWAQVIVVGTQICTKSKQNWHEA